MSKMAEFGKELMKPQRLNIVLASTKRPVYMVVFWKTWKWIDDVAIKFATYFKQNESKMAKISKELTEPQGLQSSPFSN